jgi:hypothetical protein
MPTFEDKAELSAGPRQGARKGFQISSAESNDVPGSGPTGIAGIKKIFREFGLLLKLLQLKPGSEIVSADLALLHL